MQWTLTLNPFIGSIYVSSNGHVFFHFKFFHNRRNGSVQQHLEKSTFFFTISVYWSFISMPPLIRRRKVIKRICGVKCSFISKIRQSTIYNAGLLGRWSKRIVDQASDVPSIILFSSFLRLRTLQTLFLFFFLNFFNKNKRMDFNFKKGF